MNNYVNNGQANVLARAFNPNGTPARLMDLEDMEVYDLEDLAAFNQIQQNAQMNFTGNHTVKNLNTGVKSMTNFNDHKQGQAVQVANTNNMGQMNIRGLHKFDNFVNNGVANVMPRAFNPDGTPARLMELDEDFEVVELEDLANFNNIQQNAQMNFTGTHGVKNLNTGAKSTTNFNDHKQGQFVTVANTTNGGKMNISGLHKFDNFTNNGVANVMPR